MQKFCLCDDACYFCVFMGWILILDKLVVSDIKSKICRNVATWRLLCKHIIRAKMGSTSYIYGRSCVTFLVLFIKNV
jgi:hypothetical protein